MNPRKESRLLRVGILGCGPIAQIGHLEACQKARNADLYAVCDAAEDLAQKMGSFYGAKKVYTSYKEMLADPEVEMILIATSDSFHVQASLMALEAGKHVLVEKPMAMDTSSARELYEAANKTHLICQVGHNKRFDPGILSAKAFVENEMGDIIAYKGWYCDSTHRYHATDSVHPVIHRSVNSIKPGHDPKANLRQYYMLAHGSHLIDLAHFLAGSIKSVQAQLVEKGGIFSWFIDTEFENGNNGHLDLTVAIRDDWSEGFEMYGTKGTVRGNIFNPWYMKPSQVRCFSEEKGRYEEILNNNANTYKLQIEGMADTILHGKPQIGATASDGLHSVEVMVAVSQSVITGKRIFTKDISGSI